MDLRLFFGVVARFKWLLITGTVLAIVLAVLAYGTPGLSHGKATLKPRSSEIWESEAELIVTRAGSASGSNRGPAAADGASTAESAGVEEEEYFATLAPIYTAVANGNAVQEPLHVMRVPGTVKAAEDR